MGKNVLFGQLFFLAMLLPVHAEESPKQQVDAIIQSLKAGDVARIEVFGVPPERV